MHGPGSRLAHALQYPRILHSERCRNPLQSAKPEQNPSLLWRQIVQRQKRHHVRSAAYGRRSVERELHLRPASSSPLRLAAFGKNSQLQ